MAEVVAGTGNGQMGFYAVMQDLERLPLRRALRGHLQRLAVEYAIRPTVVGRAETCEATACHRALSAHELLLLQAGQQVGRKVSAFELQSELVSRGRRDLAKRVGNSNRVRRAQAHPDVSLANDIVSAMTFEGGASAGDNTFQDLGELDEDESKFLVADVDLAIAGLLIELQAKVGEVELAAPVSSDTYEAPKQVENNGVLKGDLAETRNTLVFRVSAKSPFKTPSFSPSLGAL